MLRSVGGQGETLRVPQGRGDEAGAGPRDVLRTGPGSLAAEVAPDRPVTEDDPVIRVATRDFR